MNKYLVTHSFAAVVWMLSASTLPAITITVTNTADDGPGTLRAAITNANGTPGVHQIVFDLTGGGPYTIQPLSPLPTITSFVNINGYSQTGTSTNTATNSINATLLIELNGSLATNISGVVTGLVINTNLVTVQGLVINGFSGPGIAIINDVEPTYIYGNFIGTDATGMTALGNGEAGIYLSGDTCRIGSTSLASRNLISGNTNDGILVTDFSQSAFIEGNFIGTDKNGNPVLGNGGHGIHTGGCCSRIGAGDGTGAGNLIAGNLKAGVFVGNVQGGIFPQGPGNRNDIRGNTIYSNGWLGIDLVTDTDPTSATSVATNDACDADGLFDGGNSLQNYPVLTNVVSAGGNTTISGYLDSVPNSTFQLEFFSNTECDPSGHGEGATLIGRTNLMSGGSCSNNFVFIFPVSVAGGTFLTATASRSQNGGLYYETSEFSECFALGGVDVTPVLSAVGAGAGQVQISWTPDTGTNWVLQENTNVVTINWVNSPSGATNPIVVPATSPTKFYRLFK